MIKTLSKVAVEGAFLNIIKAIYERPTANTILNGQKTKGFPTEIRNKTRVTPILFNIVFDVLATMIIQEINKKHPNWKGGSKTVTVWRGHDSVLTSL